MQFNKPTSSKYRHAALVALLTLALVQVFPIVMVAQNPGSAPVFDKAVQGQQATQPKALS
jgi:hypothetical protein